MFVKKGRIGNLLILFLFFILLSGCNKEKTVENHYFLSLMGESNSWKVEKYELSITPKELKAGDGLLYMKEVSDYQSKDFGIEVHAVITNKDTVIQAKHVTGSETNIASMTTGSIEGGTYFKQDGNPIELEDISRIYMTIQWYDPEKGETLKESIELYN